MLSLGGRAGYAPVNKLVFALQNTLGTALVLSWAGAGGLLVTALTLGLRPKGLLRGEDVENDAAGKR